MSKAILMLLVALALAGCSGEDTPTKETTAEEKTETTAPERTVPERSIPERSALERTTEATTEEATQEPEPAPEIVVMEPVAPPEPVAPATEPVAESVAPSVPQVVTPLPVEEPVLPVAPPVPQANPPIGSNSRGPKTAPLNADGTCPEGFVTVNAPFCAEESPNTPGAIFGFGEGD